MHVEEAAFWWPGVVWFVYLRHSKLHQLATVGTDS